MRKIGHVDEFHIDHNNGSAMAVISTLPNINVDITQFQKSQFHFNILESHNEIVDDKTTQIIDKFEIECVTLE